MFELVGYRYVDMKTTDGGTVKGYSCFFLNHEEQDGLEGAEAMKQFFSSEKFPDFKPKVKQLYDLRFNQKGTLMGYEELDG